MGTRDVTAAYKAFVVKHASLLTTFESVAQALTWLLPNRSDELVLEAASSAVGLLSIINERIILSASQSTPPPSATTAPTPPLLPWPLWLAMVSQVEILAEMVAARVTTQHRSKYTLLAAVEAVKVLLRVGSLRHTRSRVLAGGGVLGPLQQWSCSPPPPLLPLLHATPGGVRPEHQAILRVADALNVFRQTHSLALLPPASCLRWYALAAGVHPSTQHTEGGDDEWMPATAEFLFLFRPVVYALALAKCGDRAWRPWLMSLAMDLTSDSLYETYQRRSPARVLVEERAQLQQRRVLWAYYVWRQPCFHRCMLPPLRRLEQTLSRVPAVGSLYAKLLDIVVSLQGFYFYTSAS